MSAARKMYCGDEGGVIKSRRRPIREINDLQLRRRQRRIAAMLDDDSDVDELLNEAMDAGRKTPSIWHTPKSASQADRQLLRHRLRRFLELLPDGMTVAEAIDILTN